jgi:hypothetical protein
MLAPTSLSLSLLPSSAIKFPLAKGITPKTSRLVSFLPLRSKPWLDAMVAALTTQLLTQQLTLARIEQTHAPAVPLDLNLSADPARRRAVVSGFYFHTAIQMNCSLAVLVAAKGFHRQGQQGRLFFSEHGQHLALRRAVNACVGPAFFPLIQVVLRFFDAFEALPFELSLQRVTDTAFTLPLRSGSPTRQGMDCAVVCQHIAVERVQRGIVNIGFEHALTQVVGHNDLHGTAEFAEARAFSSAQMRMLD